MFSIISILVILLSSSPYSIAQTASSPSLSPSLSPSPAPAPPFVNLDDLLSVAGPFHTFLNYIQKTQVLQTFQNQANNTQQGLTLFVPTDAAFKALRKPSLSNLTDDQLKSLLLFHSFPKYYSLSDFKSLSNGIPVSTLAGGLYTLNLTDAAGLVRVHSGWTSPKISSSVYSTFPVAVYELDRVLLPEAIFGAAPPPAPAPAPTPDISPAADLAPSLGGSSASHKSAKASSNESFGCRLGVVSHLALGASCLVMMLMMV